MVRALPCSYCIDLLKSDETPPELRTRIGSGIARLKDGKPYTIGRTPTKFPFRVWCATCRRATWLTAQEYNRLPRIEASSVE